MRMPSIGITCYASQGGSGVVATELGLHLARRGCAVHFISRDMPFRLRRYQENIFYHKVDIPDYPVFLHPPYTLSLATAMAEVSQSANLDILHVHYAIPHAASAYLARQMVGPDKLKVITTLHGTDITLVGQEPSYFPMTRFLINESDVVTAVSTSLADETRRVFDITRPIEVIPNFVDGRAFRPRSSFEQRDLAGADELVVMHASNFREVKNVPAVIKTFAAVADDFPARLVLVGDGPELSAARQQIQAAGLEAQVTFLGAVDRFEDILPQADVLLLPSLHESFGLVALEAMACGVVPIVTNRGGTDEFVSHGLNGFLCDPHDIDAQVNALRRLLSDATLRQQMAEEARRDAASEFGVSCIVRKYLSLYDELLSTVE